MSSLESLFMVAPSREADQVDRHEFLIRTLTNIHWIVTDDLSKTRLQRIESEELGIMPRPEHLPLELLETFVLIAELDGERSGTRSRSIHPSKPASCSICRSYCPKPMPVVDRNWTHGVSRRQERTPSPRANAPAFAY